MPSIHTRSFALAALCAAACASASACASAPRPSLDAAPSALVADRLFFGRSIPGGATVSDAQWDAFARDVVTPRFPDGLSLWRGEGQWRGRSGEIVREAVIVLELVHPTDAVVDSSLRLVAEEYKRRFRQESVLRVTTPASARLLDD